MPLAFGWRSTTYQATGLMFWIGLFKRPKNVLSEGSQRFRFNWDFGIGFGDNGRVIGYSQITTYPAWKDEPTVQNQWSWGSPYREPKATGLEGLIAKAASYRMTIEEEDAQRRSFVYGNLKLHNTEVTWDMIDQAFKDVNLRRQALRGSNETYLEKSSPILSIIRDLNIDPAKGYGYVEAYRRWLRDPEKHLHPLLEEFPVMPTAFISLVHAVGERYKWAG